MNKSFIWMVGSLVICGLGTTFVLGDGAHICKMPNPNTQPCHSPSNNGDCDGNDPVYCDQMEKYTIEQFPIDSVDALKGTTYQPQRNCYRKQACFWNTDTNSCTVAPTYSGWFKKGKIEQAVYTNGIEPLCPEELEELEDPLVGQKR